VLRRSCHHLNRRSRYANWFVYTLEFAPVRMTKMIQDKEFDFGKTLDSEYESLVGDADDDGTMEIY